MGNPYMYDGKTVWKVDFDLTSFGGKRETILLYEHTIEPVSSQTQIQQKARPSPPAQAAHERVVRRIHDMEQATHSMAEYNIWILNNEIDERQMFYLEAVPGKNECYFIRGSHQGKQRKEYVHKLTPGGLIKMMIKNTDIRTNRNV